MPTLESENIGQFDFEIFLKENGCYRNNNDIYPIIILDDLDEIHPKSSEALLEKIDDFIQNKEKSDVSLNFIIFGRTESFSWFSSPHCTRKNLFEFRIHGLDYSYEQDMKIMAMTYLVYYKKEKETDQVVKKTIDIINKYPFLIYTIKNLDNSLFLMKRILENAKKTELKLKEELLDEIIGRNSSTHKRPPTGTSKGLEYIRLLENIAGEYFNKIDKEGYFEVSIQDQIKLIKKEEEQKCDELKDLSDCNIDTYNFDVQSVLNFSGLVEVKPINHIVKKYRFEPFWIHELLISKRQKRINIP